MRLAVIGSRSSTDYDVFSKKLSKHIKGLEERGYVVEEIVSGGANGADALARVYALSHGIVLKEFLPDYKKYGRGAPAAPRHRVRRSSVPRHRPW